MHETLLEASKGIVDFEETTIDLASDKGLNLESFRKKGVLYYFQILNEVPGFSKDICQAVERLKKDVKFKPKLPKVNTENSSINGKENDVLYVGKSSGYLHTRLRQHLGNESEKTYALHLNQWKRHPVLSRVKLKLYWTQVNVAKYYKESKRQQELLELLETGLHRELKPILGRSGH